MRKTKNDIERFSICKRCSGTNTSQNGTSDDEYHIWFYGWCFDCERGYVYDVRVQTVSDKEGRL